MEQPVLSLMLLFWSLVYFCITYKLLILYNVTYIFLYRILWNSIWWICNTLSYTSNRILKLVFLANPFAAFEVWCPNDISTAHFVNSFGWKMSYIHLSNDKYLSKQIKYLSLNDSTKKMFLKTAHTHHSKSMQSYFHQKWVY